MSQDRIGPLTLQTCCATKSIHDTLVPNQYVNIVLFHNVLPFCTFLKAYAANEIITFQSDL